MGLTLTSVYAKLARAQEHFESVDEEILKWMADSHHTYSVEPGAYDTRVGLLIHFQGATPDFVRWSLIIADCVSNLRSSLDHLIYAVAQHYMRNQLSPDIEHLAFIITDSPDLSTEITGTSPRSE